MIPKPLAVLIVCLVTLVWIGNFFAQFLVAGYTVDGWIHTIFLSVVGGALVASRKNSGGGDGGTPPPPALPADGENPTPPPPPEPPRSGGAHRASLTLLPEVAL